MAFRCRQKLSLPRGQKYNDVIRSQTGQRGDLARYACLVVAVISACPPDSDIVNGKAVGRINYIN
jgi:hypothetical protein